MPLIRLRSYLPPVLAMLVLSVSPGAAGAAEVLKAKVELSTVYPNPPSVRKVWDRGVLGKDTPWYWDSPPLKRASAQPIYEPTADGFTRLNGKRQPLGADQVHHWLVYQNNQVHVGDRPVANVRVLAASAMYGEYDTFPITGIGKEAALKRGTAFLSLGAVRFAARANGRTEWLDRFPRIRVSYRAGEAEWHCRHPEMGIDLTLHIRPNISARGLIARIEVKSAPSQARLSAYCGGLGLSCWPYANFAYQAPNLPCNAPATIELSRNGGRLGTATLPRAQVFFGVSGQAAVAALAPENVFDIDNEQITPADEPARIGERQCIRVDSDLAPGGIIHSLLVWGADGYDERKMLEIKKKLPVAALASPENDKVWKTWFDNFIGMQLEPGKKFERLMANPAGAWAESEAFWKDRARRWTIDTPDPSLSAAVNWTGQTLEYFRQPPGYMVGQTIWCGFGHITSGWNALGAMGDDEDLELLLGLHAATRSDPSPPDQDPRTLPCPKGSKEIRWTFLNLDTAVSEPLNAPWLDHVWTWWQWTGNQAALKALWPAVRDAIRGEMVQRDRDQDGLYNGFYEFWDCDREQRGDKAAGETAWMIESLRGAARMAKALRRDAEAAYYDAEAEKSAKAWQEQLWYPAIGQCGARTADGQRYERASIHEVFLPAIRGVLSEKQAAQAFRRLQYLYGQTSKFGLPLLFKNDCWPVFWSQHYMPPGDISLAYLGAAKCGLAAEYFPYYELISHAPFKSHHAGFGLSIGRDGATDAQQIGVMDAQAPFAWAAAEGLFGIAPDGQPDRVRIAPNFPAQWPEASGSFGGLALKMQRAAQRVELSVVDAKRRGLRIQWPTRSPVAKVLLDGKESPYKIITAVNRALVEVQTRAEQPVRLEYEFAPQALEISPMAAETVAGASYELKAAGGRITEVDDPQQALQASRIDQDGTGVSLVPGAEGFHTIFVRLARESFSYWAPVSFATGPAWRIVSDFQAPEVPRSAPIRQAWPNLDCAARTMNVRIENRQAKLLRDKAQVTIAGETSDCPVEIAPGSTMDLSVRISERAWKRLLPGSVEIEVRLAGLTQRSKVCVWPTAANPRAPQAPPAERLVLLDIDAARNLTRKQMLEQSSMPVDWQPPDHPELADRLIGGYNWDFIMNALPRRFEPIPGLPMAMSALDQKPDGEPMLVLAHGAFKGQPLPTRARFEIGRKVERAYVLTVFNSYTIKCYARHVEWILTYGDGTREVVSWVPPYDVDGYQRPESPWSLPVTAVGQFAEDHSKAGDHAFGPFHAQLVDFPINPAKTLLALEARHTQTESLTGILGLTLVKPEG